MSEIRSRICSMGAIQESRSNTTMRSYISKAGDTLNIQRGWKQESSFVPSRLKVLSSWKEISSYLSQAVRTVQRWEASLGLPVHRPCGHARSRVIAFPKELDQWLARTPCRREQRAETAAQISELTAKIARLEAENKRLKAQLATSPQSSL